MQDVFIPLGLLLFIVLFAFALVHTARQQKKAKSAVFRAFADSHGLHYQALDKGSAQQFATGFDGIGRFSSPSLGNVIPKDVVSGRFDGKELLLFRHSIRFAEGWAREWFVAGVKHSVPLANHCTIQFCRKTSDIQTMYLSPPVIKQQRLGEFLMVVRADEQASASFLDDAMLAQLAQHAASMNFRPEVQIRGDRVAVYPADREITLDSTVLAQLAGFACYLSGLFQATDTLTP